tara:strand:- start:3690 stop:4340 length:651 start_codon:yes stop_codon:yes gene_type:complete
MPIIYSDTEDGFVLMSNSNWALARDAGTGSSFSSTGTGTAFAVRADVSAGRGGTTYFITRSFFEFNTSAIKSNVLRATLNIRGQTNGAADVIAVKASQGSSLSTADFDAIVGWSTSGTDGSGGGDNRDNVTNYSNEIETWSTSGYNNIDLTSIAKTDMLADDALYVCIMEYDHDLKDVAPTGTNRTGVYYTNYTGTSRDPYIEYELDNAVFFGTNF